MESLTAAITAAGVLVIATARPIHGLVAYLSVLFVYPDYIRVSFGTIDISATRILVCVLLLRCLIDPQIMAKFRWIALDTLLSLSMVVYAATLVFTTPFQVWLENRGGFVMDTLFAYLVVRLTVVDRAAFVIVAKVAAVLTAFLAGHAVVEALTGRSLYAGLGQYCPWAPLRGSVYQTRHGLNRAEGPFSETIMFGLFFVSVLPFIWMLRLERPPWRNWSYPLCLTAGLGTLATVSSGAYVALAVTLACLALQRVRHVVRPLIVVVVVLCGIVEIISNRHIWDVIGDYVALDSGNAWYRSQLLRIAYRQLPEYWSVGYGLVDPGWGPLIDGRLKTDGVNDYVVHAVVYGLPGLAIYVFVLVEAICTLTRADRATQSPWIRSCTWVLGSTLIGLMVSFWTVSVYTQMTTVFHILLGLHGAMRRCVVAESMSGMHRTEAVEPASLPPSFRARLRYSPASRALH